MEALTQSVNHWQLTETEQQLAKFLSDFKRHFQKKQPIAPSIYYCGGWVRDKLLGVESKDLDMIMSQDFVQIFIDFMSSLAKKNQMSFEHKNTQPLSTLNCRDMKLYQVSFQDLYIDIRELWQDKSLEDDLRTRDFRCNSLYYDPVEKMVIDYKQGIKDIHERIIRVIFSYEDTFLSDFSRFIRLIRFKVVKKMLVDPDIDRWIRSLSFADIKKFTAMNQGCKGSVFREISRILQLDQCIQIFEEIHRLNIFNFIFYENGLGSSDLEHAMVLMGKIEAVYKSPLFIKYGFDVDNHWRRHISFKNAFLFVCFRSEKKMGDYKRIFKNHKNGDYQMSLYHQFIDSNDKLFFKELDFDSEKSAHYPALIVLLEKTKLESLKDSNAELPMEISEYLKACKLGGVGVVDISNYINQTNLTSSNTDYANFLSKSPESQEDHLIRLVSSKNIPAMKEFLGSAHSLDFGHFKKSQMQRIILTSINVLKETKGFPKSEFLSFYVQSMRARTKIPVKINPSFDELTFFLECFFEFCERTENNAN